MIDQHEHIFVKKEEKSSEIDSRDLLFEQQREREKKLKSLVIHCMLRTKGVRRKKTLERAFL